MAITFPTTLDTLADVTAHVTPIAAANHNDIQDAIEALEAKVGVNSSAVTTSLDYMMANARRFTVAASDSDAGDKATADYVGDGTADDVEINAALTAAATVQGAVVLLPGSYDIRAGLTIGANGSGAQGTGGGLFGCGPGTRLLLSSTVTGAINIIANKDATNGNKNIRVSNLMIDGTAAQAGCLAAQSGVKLILCSYFMVDHCWIQHLGKSSIASCCGVQPAGCDHGIVESNIVQDAVDDINMSASGSTYCSFLHIVNNQCLGTNKDYPIYLFQCNDSVVSGNIVTGAGAGGAAVHNIYVRASARNIITGNIVRDQVGAAAMVRLGSLSSVHSQNNIIAFNIIRKGTGSGTYQIQIDANNTGNYVFFNDFRDQCATGAVLNNGSAILRGNIYDAGVGVDPNYAGDASIFGSFSVTDAKDITLGTTTGTKIGAAANQKLGFFGATPVVQQAKSGTWDADKLAIALKNLGLIDADNS